MSVKICIFAQWFCKNAQLMNSRGYGGRGGIRTHETFRFAGFQDQCLQPDSATLPLMVDEVGVEPTNLFREGFTIPML